ncbi:MAG TPA: hypothetical protein DCO86_05735 [Spirochaetaceae bacterium]|nr:hypothetical protein [Spirochaetaceae bacterium]
MSVEFNITLTKPDLEVSESDDEAFELVISGGSMNVSGIDFLYGYYPALSRVVEKVNVFLNDESGKNDKSVFEVLSNIDYFAEFSNSKFVHADSRLCLKYGEQYMVVGTIDEEYGETDGCKGYYLKTDPKMENIASDALKVVVYADTRQNLIVGRKYLLTTYVRKIAPFALEFTVNKCALFEGDASDGQEDRKFKELVDILSVKDDGRLVTILEKEEVDLKVRRMKAKSGS